MKISELIKELEEQKEKHGDCDIALYFEGCWSEYFNFHYEPENKTKDGMKEEATLYMGEEWS